MTRFLWAIEEWNPSDETAWSILPNTVAVRRYHCDSDIKGLRKDCPLSMFRIVKYERTEPHD